MTKFTRRQFIFTAGVSATTALIANGCSSGSSTSEGTGSSPAASPAVNVSGADAPEVTTARLGFIALTDAAPLIVAKEKGMFAKYGMPDVEVLKQASWGATRDNLELGSGGGGIDGAHILTPMPYLITAGAVTKNKQSVPMYVLARLNYNGQCISVAATHKGQKVTTDSSPLKAVFDKAKAEGKEMKCAVTFPGGTHDLWTRYWLAAGGIDPNADASLIVVPPPQMVANMKVGTMETFCVCEPWNKQAINQGIAFTALTTGELWNDHPEKALGMRADWVDKNPKAAKALLMAVMEAQQWCDKPENVEEMVNIISKREWIKVPVADVIERAQGKFDYGDGRPVVEKHPYMMRFWENNASYPYKSHDLWFVTEDMRWGYLPGDTNAKELVDKVNREDIWREAAKTMGLADADIPKGTSRGVETFFDGVKFDPENPSEYLKNLKIKKV